jgi:hypothetical protein
MKKMNKKKWALVILCPLFIYGYVKLFYKTYSEKVVAKSADDIIAIDVKRIANTVIWDVLTTPSKWKLPSFSSVATDEVSIQDMIEIPDYLFAFHPKGQSNIAWYTAITVKDNDAFEKGMKQFHFVKSLGGKYINDTMGIQITQKNNQLLVTHASVQASELESIWDEIFVQKQSIAKDELASVIKKNSHVAMKFSKNNFAKEDFFTTINFDATQINMQSTILPNDGFVFAENNFSFGEDNLFSLGCTQPNQKLYSLLSEEKKANISKALNINIDSFMLPTNKFYQLSISGFKTRADSAITYTYDDDFNKIEKVVVNNVEEPAYEFFVNGQDVNRVYNNWLQNSKLEKLEAGYLFTPVPFVKSYCTVEETTKLIVAPKNFVASKNAKNSNCIFFINILVEKLPPAYMKYLPNDAITALKNVKQINVVANKEGNTISIKGNLVATKQKFF